MYCCQFCVNLTAIRWGDTQGSVFLCLSMYLACCFFFSVVHERFSYDHDVFRRCYTRYYMPLFFLHCGVLWQSCYTIYLFDCSHVFFSIHLVLVQRTFCSPRIAHGSTFSLDLLSMRVHAHFACCRGPYGTFSQGRFVPKAD